MNKFIDIVNDQDYQALFFHHIKLESPLFIQNGENCKSEFLFNEQHHQSIQHDNIIRNAYAFLSTDQGLFLLHELNSDPNDCLVIFIDNESQIQIVGSTPIDFVLNFEYLTLSYEVNELDLFFSNYQVKFGDPGKAKHFFDLNVSKLY